MMKKKLQEVKDFILFSAWVIAESIEFLFVTVPYDLIMIFIDSLRNIYSKYRIQKAMKKYEK